MGTLSIFHGILISIAVIVVFILAICILHSDYVKFKILCKKYEYLYDVGIAKNKLFLKNISSYEYYSVIGNMVRSISPDVFNEKKYKIATNYHNDEIYNSFIKDINFITKIVKDNEVFFYMVAKYNCLHNKSIFSLLDVSFDEQKLILEYYKNELLSKNIDDVDKHIIDNITIKLFNKSYNKETSSVEMRVYKQKTTTKKTTTTIEVKEDEKISLHDDKYDDTIDIINSYVSTKSKKEIKFDGKSWR